MGEEEKKPSRIVTELLGPDATQAEIALTFGIAILSAVAIILYQFVVGLNWNILQMIVGGFVALDIGGGVIANSTNSAKKWFHREGRGFKDYFVFILVHFINILLVTVFFTVFPFDWVFFGYIYGYLIISAVIILKSPLYLKRPVSILMTCIGIVTCIYLLTSIPGFEWFVPLLYIKLLVGHLVPEKT